MTSKLFWPTSIVAYFVFHTAYRVALGGSLGLDEAQIILHGQSFAWGYGPQPPLYGWLQGLVFFVTGPSIFGLAVLKNTLLCATVLTIYGLIRTQHQAHVAGLAAVSLLLLPQISWASQRALTHSVLVSLSAALTFAIVWWIIRRPSWVGFVALGLVLAMGMLAKFNYALFAAAVFLAALSLPKARRALWSGRLFLSLGIAGVLVARPVIWMIDNRDVALSSARKFDIIDSGILVTAAQSMAAWAEAVFSFLILLAVVTGLLFWRHSKAGPARLSMQEQLIWRSLLIGAGLLAVVVLGIGATSVRDRWLQPVLILAAPATILWLQRRLSVRGIRRLWQTYGVLAVLIVVALPIHNFRGRAYRAAPYGALSAMILDGLPDDTILVARTWVAGNLFFRAPERTIFSTAHPMGKFDETRTYALIWQGRDPAKGLAILRGADIGRADLRLGTPRVLTAAYLFASERIFTLSVALVQPAAAPEREVSTAPDP